MPIFSFEGRREDTGEVVSGAREAVSHTALGQDLLSEGVLLTRFEEKKRKSPADSIFASLLAHVPVLERLLFARYFALMLRAGLDVKRSLAALAEQTRSKPMKAALQSVYQGIERGQQLAESMAAHTNVFSELFVSFIRVGEASGRLQESLEILAKQLQKEFELKRAVRGGLLYPAIIVLALIAVGIAMMIFVIPKLVEVFEGFDVELPLTTRILITTSGFFHHYWYLVILIVIILVGGSWGLLRVKSVKAFIMHWMLYVPIIGNIIQRVNLARFSRNISSLLDSGVPFIETLQILGENTPHPSYAAVFAGAADYVKQGKELSAYLSQHEKLFPSLVTNIMKVGEETGELAAVLQEVAIFYESEVDQTMKNLTSVMEPVLMVVIGLAVGALAISIISPIYGLVNVI
ncbi:MAG: type II secretion system F family protein [Candidatus Andersenbacteria bacterium]|nr:type II secretion system F family protein [Candidatus Andersenbacteria bacterium]MBI3250948.1 type II secretion system F family protein [Candidatus Andersenbacteria bacterium]